MAHARFIMLNLPCKNTFKNPKYTCPELGTIRRCKKHLLCPKLSQIPNCISHTAIGARHVALSHLFWFHLVPRMFGRSGVLVAALARA